MAVVGSIDFLGPHDASALGKPYSLRYEPHASIAKTNFSSEPFDQIIEDIRGREESFSVAQNGFQLLRLESRLVYSDFDDKDKVVMIFYKEVAHAVKQMLGATRVQIFEHVVSYSANPFAHILKAIAPEASPAVPCGYRRSISVRPADD